MAQTIPIKGTNYKKVKESVAEYFSKIKHVLTIG